MKNCNHIKEKLIDFIELNLSKTEIELVENHLQNCENCTKELREMQQLFNVINSDVEELPSKSLQLKLDDFLSEEKKKLNTKIVQLKPKQDWKQYLRIVASITIVVSAFLIGKNQSNITNKIANKSSKKEQKVLAMLTNKSASKRIHAIDLSEEITKPNNIIIEALVSRLFNDENTNVRLASAEALAKFSSSETVRNALIKALETDKEPTVQIELIQILAEIQEKRALKPMKKLLELEETPSYIKQKLKLNIAQLL